MKTTKNNSTPQKPQAEEKPTTSTEWELEQKELFLKQGLSVDDPDDEAAQQIHFEHRQLLIKALTHQRTALIEQIQREVNSINNPYMKNGSSEQFLGAERMKDVIFNKLTALRKEV